MTTVGHVSDIIEKLNLRQYSEMCKFDTTASNMVGKTKPERLKEHLGFMQKKSIGIIESLSQEDLNDKIEYTKTEHPIAKNKIRGYRLER